MTLAQSDRALTTCGASLLQLKAFFLYLVRFPLFSGVHVFLLFLFYCNAVKLIVIFPPMTSIKKTDCPLQKGVKRTRKTVTLETKMLVIRKMEAGEKRANMA